MEDFVESTPRKIEKIFLPCSGCGEVVERSRNYPRILCKLCKRTYHREYSLNWWALKRLANRKQ